MAEYFLAPSLHRLRTEINNIWPDRDTKSDGWIGDTAHAARKSDHNPDWDAPGARRGIVRAMDVDKDGIDVGEILDRTIGREPVEYVIYGGYIYSRVRDFERKVYTGVNAHKEHIHISIKHSQEAEYWHETWLPYVQHPIFPKPPVLQVGDSDMWLGNVAGPDPRVFLITSLGKALLTPEQYKALGDAREKGIVREAEVGSAFLNLLPSIELPKDLVELHQFVEPPTEVPDNLTERR